MSAPKIGTLPDFYKDAVNVLFAVVIGLSFSVAGKVVIPVQKIPSDPLGTGILILGYVIVVTGWIGYSLSIKTSPHRVGIPGLIRFGLDIITIFLFYYIVSLADPDNISYRHDVFLYLLPALYIVYLTWDITKYYEYKKITATLSKKDRIRRIEITVDYLVIFIAMSFVYWLALSNFRTPTKGYFQWDMVFVILSMIFTLNYRRAKWRDTIQIRSRKRSHKKSKHKSADFESLP